MLAAAAGCNAWPKKQSAIEPPQPLEERADQSQSPLANWFAPRSEPSAPASTSVGPPPDELQPTDIPRLDLQLRVLLIRIPKTQRAAAEPLWTYVREDILDAEIHRRLRENGIRVGLSRRDGWQSMRAILDGVTGRLVQEPAPVRLPPGFPLALELDDGPHDQTLFYLNESGVLTGHTWPKSRNSLRLTATLDPSVRGRLRLELVPEVRTRPGGLEWIRTSKGIIQQSRTDGMAFKEAGFYLPLGNEDILMLAPNDKADTYGIIGGAFLTDDTQGVSYDRYILIRPDTSL